MVDAEITVFSLGAMLSGSMQKMLKNGRQGA